MNLPPRIRLALADLRRQREEPLCAYLYDLPALAERVRAMRAALPPACELFYAAKANPEEAILRTLAPLVDGFEAASGGELAWLRQHCPEHPLIFGGPGKLESELDAALLANLDAFHVESLHELRRLASLARRRERRIPLLLRLNLKLDETPDSRLVMGGKPTPFGLDEEALDEALALLREEPALELKGLHFHLLSHQLDVSAHLQLVRAYCRAFLRIAGESGLPLSLLNVGGGMGIDYRDFARSFDWSGFCDALPALLDEEGMGVSACASRLAATSPRHAATTRWKCSTSSATMASFSPSPGAAPTISAPPRRRVTTIPSSSCAASEPRKSRTRR